MKVITLTGMVILGIVLDFGGGPNHDLIGFQYWKNPGPFFSFDGIRGISLDGLTLSPEQHSPMLVRK